MKRNIEDQKDKDSYFLPNNNTFTEADINRPVRIPKRRKRNSPRGKIVFYDIMKD
jgi:hypothetical protein